MSYVSEVIAATEVKNACQPEFLQTVKEVLTSLQPVIDANEDLYRKHAVLERMVEPDRQIIFRVPWVDDNGVPRVNRGFRVQFNNAIGPYKGGLRFHPSVNISIMKFLGFEQTFKNSLTGLPMGGGKGGADFDPRGKSEGEIMRFCQSFMTELFRHIGPDIDIPAGDIGVGGKEIGFLYGQYKRIVGSFGNVSWGAAKKITELGGKVVSISGPDGYVYDPDGISGEKIDYMLEMRASLRDKVKDYADKFGVKFVEGQKPWGNVKADIYMPCATQNEIRLDDAKKIVDMGVKIVNEVSNMPTTNDALAYLQQNGVLVAPSKAVNAGGVAVSGLEMSQNSERISWSAEEVDGKLKNIMSNIHKQIVKACDEFNLGYNLVAGANVAGFKKVAEAMIDQGIV